MALNPHLKLCTHVKVTGVRCGSPALRGARFCYFHERMLHGVPTPKHARIHPVALLENEEAIQVALMEVINSILRSAIDNQRAHLIIRALNIAAKNARRVRFQGSEHEMVRQTLEPYPAEAPAAALGRIPLPPLSKTGSTKEASTKEASSKEASSKEASSKPASSKDASSTNAEGAPSLRSVQRWAEQKPAATHEVSFPRKPPARVASAVIAQAKAAMNAVPVRE